MCSTKMNIGLTSTNELWSYAHNLQFAKHLLSHGGGQGGGNSGEYGAGGAQEVGEERWELGVIKWWEVGEKREIIVKQCLTFCNVMKKG